jgi:hypothetical protein
MTDKDQFMGQKKVRKAKIIKPPNIIKSKIGTGGLDPALIIKAEENLANHTADFRPIAEELLKELGAAIDAAKNNPTEGEEQVEAILYPAAQFKALGAMFRFPLVSDIGDILVNFLETLTTPLAEDGLEILNAHKHAIAAIIHKNITTTNDPLVDELKRTLAEACVKYYKKRQAQ